MRRREFITLGGGAAIAWPFTARAQQPAMPVIGFLTARSPAASARVLGAFRQGLSESGYFEGKNVAIEYRWAEGRYDQLPALAAELVQHRVAVLSAFSTDAVLAAKQASAAIPIVFVQGGDPVKLGMVASLNRPGGNITGVTFLTTELVAKRVEVLHDLMPKATLIGHLNNPNLSTAEIDAINARTAANAFGLKVVDVKAATERDFESAFATLAQQRVEALLVGSDPFFNSHVETLTTLAAHYKLPAIYQLPEYVAAGGLMSYGANIDDAYRLAGVYAGRVLKGEKPADLPIQQSAKIELIINLKVAKSLGLTVPTLLLNRAEQVIE